MMGIAPDYLAPWHASNLHTISQMWLHWIQVIEDVQHLW